MYRRCGFRGMDEACGFVRCCGWPFHFSNFHAFDELDLALSEVWTPWGGGRTWVLVMAVGVNGGLRWLRRWQWLVLDVVGGAAEAWNTVVVGVASLTAERTGHCQF